MYSENNESYENNGTCCFCGFECNSSSQSCGFCTRGISGHSIGLPVPAHLKKFIPGLSDIKNTVRADLRNSIDKDVDLKILCESCGTTHFIPSEWSCVSCSLNGFENESSYFCPLCNPEEMIRLNISGDIYCDFCVYKNITNRQIMFCHYCKILVSEDDKNQHGEHKKGYARHVLNNENELKELVKKLGRLTGKDYE
jgi:hypothetical protein